MDEYVAVEDESIRGIARRLGMRQTELVALNGHIPRLTTTSTLRANTHLRVPAANMRRYEAEKQARAAEAERERIEREARRARQLAEQQREA